MGAALTTGCDVSTCCSAVLSQSNGGTPAGSPLSKFVFETKGAPPQAPVPLKGPQPLDADVDEGKGKFHEPVIRSLVFVESEDRNACSPAASTSFSSRRFSSSSKASGTSKALKYNSIPMLQTAGQGIAAVLPAKLDQAELAKFRSRLAASGLDITSWGVNGAKSVEHLFWEAFQQHACVITEKAGRLKRVTCLVKIRLIAEIFGLQHVLCSRMQFMHDGQTVERMQVPLRKLIWLSDLDGEALHSLSIDEHCPHVEDWRVGARKALEERLGLPERWQHAHLEEVKGSHTFHIEDNVTSNGYPGLVTSYCIHTVTWRVSHPENPSVQCIGLPVGQEFATQEGEFNFNVGGEEGLPIGSQLNIWTWRREEEVPSSSANQDGNGNGSHRAAVGGSGDIPGERATAAGEEGGKATAQAPEKEKNDKGGVSPNMVRRDSSEGKVALIRRVPLHRIAAQDLVSSKARLSVRSPDPPALLRTQMSGLDTDWSRASVIAQRIMEPSYTLKEYYDDIQAFPEMRLYLMEERNSQVSSGRTLGDEYQRTVGAFFAIYWLFRLPIDGKDGFCFGVDDFWSPLNQADVGDPRMVPVEKRLQFYNEADWDYFRRLLSNAGLLEVEDDGTYKVNKKRFVALLALTAIHDIMKMAMLLPEVQPEHAPYHSYQAGDTIGDHDHALGYVMDFFPECLPSFQHLDAEEKRTLQFTQCKLAFNHGWFVQAEAPPGAMFTSFKEALVRDHKSLISQRDVAFYFVHWLTDLAGAEPTPLAGCEKFSAKFPLRVLNSFLRSFEFVERIATRTETEVNEEYLIMRWTDHTPSPGPVPTGASAVAKMRLLCMAQVHALAILKGFDELGEEDREVLSQELSRTGCLGQSYSPRLTPSDAHERPQGPAFLIYYGPAFLQNLGEDSPARRLSLLAELYRCSRALWPATVSKVAVNATVRVDVIKGLSTKEIMEATQEGDFWVLVKHNESEAFVEKCSRKRLNKMMMQPHVLQVLDMGCLEAYPP